MPRLFVALDLPQELKSRISELCSFGLPGVAWIETAQLHLSLRFIGEVDEQDASRIQTCLLKVRQPSFQLTLAGVGAFPQSKNPRVIWVGVEKNEALLQLRNKIERQLNCIGIPGEKRKFHPHVTLGRVKNKKISRMGDYLAHYDLFRAEPYVVEHFTLFSSLLSPSGAKYTKIAEYALQ